MNFSTYWTITLIMRTVLSLQRCKVHAKFSTICSSPFKMTDNTCSLGNQVRQKPGSAQFSYMVQRDSSASHFEGAEITFLLSTDQRQMSIRPNIHDTTGYKRTCAVEQAVLCIWPVHGVKRALPCTAGSLELGSLHTPDALFQEGMLHQPRFWLATE